MLSNKYILSWYLGRCKNGQKYCDKEYFFNRIRKDQGIFISKLVDIKLCHTSLATVLVLTIEPKITNFECHSISNISELISFPVNLQRFKIGGTQFLLYEGLLYVIVFRDITCEDEPRRIEWAEQT